MISIDAGASDGWPSFPAAALLAVACHHPARFVGGVGVLCSGLRGDGRVTVRAARSSGGAAYCAGAASIAQRRPEVVVCLVGIMVCQSVTVVRPNLPGVYVDSHGLFVCYCRVLGALRMAVI